MIYATLNNKEETMGDDVAERCGLKITKRIIGKEIRKETRGGFKIVKVKDPYYTHARQFQNGHLVYLNPYEEL